MRTWSCGYVPHWFLLQKQLIEFEPSLLPDPHAQRAGLDRWTGYSGGAVKINHVFVQRMQLSNKSFRPEHVKTRHVGRIEKRCVGGLKALARPMWRRVFLGTAVGRIGPNTGLPAWLEKYGAE